MDVALLAAEVEAMTRTDVPDACGIFFHHAFVFFHGYAMLLERIERGVCPLVAAT